MPKPLRDCFEAGQSQVSHPNAETRAACDGDVEDWAQNLRLRKGSADSFGQKFGMVAAPGPRRLANQAQAEFTTGTYLGDLLGALRGPQNRHKHRVDLASNSSRAQRGALRDPQSCSGSLLQGPQKMVVGCFGDGVGRPLAQCPQKQGVVGIGPRPEKKRLAGV